MIKLKPVINNIPGVAWLIDSDARSCTVPPCAKSRVIKFSILDSMTDKRKLALALAVGFVVGVLWFVGLRFVTYEDKRVHYHANFALYVDGVRDEFKSATFYEETQSCSADEIGPKQRVHLHDNNPGLVHVHDSGATWGHLFANLGYGLTNKSVTDDKATYLDGQNDTQVRFILNGKEVGSIANEIIQNEDKLLIDVETAKGAVASRLMPELPSDAAEYNQKSDPSTCSGSKPLTFTERLKKAVGISY